MATQELLNYIKKALDAGKSKEDIKITLLNVGWREKDIDTALDSFPVDIPKEEEPAIETEDFAASPEAWAQTERAEVATSPETGKPHVEKEKRRGRVAFIYGLAVLTIVVVAVVLVSFFSQKKADSIRLNKEEETGFEEQKVDDGKRIVETLKIQESLEKYYSEHKNYPENLNSLTDVPTASNDLKYVYTPIGLPAQSYTLNIEMKNINDGEMKVDGGFMTLKNKQGTK